MNWRLYKSIIVGCCFCSREISIFFFLVGLLILDIDIAPDDEARISVFMIGPQASHHLSVWSQASRIFLPSFECVVIGF